jgi:pimeloyl-ACP methyl ester carboxylesterase
VAAFDVRGHARSEAPDAESAYAPACFVDDVGRVLDALGVPRQPRVRRDAAVVGGLSMGAGLAARFAIAHPERVRGLVLAALAPGARGADDPGAGGARQRDWALAFADAIERDGLEAAGARYAWGPESGLDSAAAQMVRLGFLEHVPHAIAYTLRQLLADQPGWRELADALRPHGLPLLVVVGARDRVSRGASEQLAAALPGTKLVVVPGAGHVVNLEAREAVSEALARLLDALSEGATPESER